MRVGRGHAAMVGTEQQPPSAVVGVPAPVEAVDESAQRVAAGEQERAERQRTRPNERDTRGRGETVRRMAGQESVLQIAQGYVVVVVREDPEVVERVVECG